ncbi:unnamed protein product [Ilex paraguariensis]|uniref:Uncharacterized protein n=1 Tax=Ilex paraguariensis TaxID=185542 RepID=A0ABC8TNV9_9AQUA
MPDLDTAEPEEIAQDEYMGNKAEEGVVKEITPEESDLAHRSEDLEERVDTGSTMAVTEGDLFCDKQMTPNKNLRAANPKKRGEPEKSSKSKRSGAGAMTLKVQLWNVRKIGKVEKQREAKDYIRAQEADLIGLVETKVRSGKAARITRCLGKDCSKAITVENEAGNGRS